MKNTLKHTVKFAAGTCAAVSVVALGAVVASGTAVRAIAEGFKAGAEAMVSTVREIMEESKKTESEAVVTVEEAALETE